MEAKVANYVVVNYRQTPDQRAVADLACDGQIVLTGKGVNVLFNYVAEHGRRGDTYKEIDMPVPYTIEQVWAAYMEIENFYRGG